MNKKKLILYSLISGLLLGLSFPPLPFNLLAYVGFVPLLFALTHDEKPKLRYFLIYLTFFLYHSLSNWWIGSWQSETDPYLTASAIALAFVHPFFYFVPFIAFFIILKRINKKFALLMFPFIFTAFDWLHSLGEASYPWLAIGNTQIQNLYWIQFIDITGIWGASFLVVMCNVLVLYLIMKYNESKSNYLKNNYISITGLILIFLLPFIYSIFSIDFWKNTSESDIYGKKVNIGVVQPSVNPWRKWDSSPYDQVKNQILLQDSLLKINPKLDLMIWSETSIPTHINYENISEYNFLQNWVDNSNVSLLTGFVEIDLFEDTTKAPLTARYLEGQNVKYESYNSAMILNPNARNNDSYRKMRLTPLAERLPYAEALLFMRSWFEWGVGISSWGIGKIQKVLTLDNKNIKIAPIICIESIYPEFVSDFAELGASIFVIITNDAWYNYTPGPRQHFLIAQARAIENRRFIVRCANSGISGLISSWGTSVDEIPPYIKAAKSFEVPSINYVTFYTQIGAWLPILSLLVTFIFIIYGYIKK